MLQLYGAFLNNKKKNTEIYKNKRKKEREREREREREKHINSEQQLCLFS